METKSTKVGEAAERIADAVDNVSEVDPSFIKLSLLADFYSETLILFSQDDCVIFSHGLSLYLYLYWQSCHGTHVAQVVETVEVLTELSGILARAAGKQSWWCR